MNGMDLSALFGGSIERGPNGTFLAGVKQGGAPRHLAGEADIMQISGVPHGLGTPPTFQPEAVMPPPGPVSLVGAPPPITASFAQPVTVGKVTLPFWQWLILAALLGGAGGYYLGRR